MISEREICESAAENHNRLIRKADVSNRILDALVTLQLLTELIQLTTAPHLIFVKYIGIMIIFFSPLQKNM